MNKSSGNLKIEMDMKADSTIKNSLNLLKDINIYN